jgi:hypothetical protein
MTERLHKIVLVVGLLTVERCPKEIAMNLFKPGSHSQHGVYSIYTCPAFILIRFVENHSEKYA